MQQIQQQTEAAVRELITVAGMRPGQVLVVGCSSSEIMGETIGTDSRWEAACAVVDGLMPVLREKEIFLAAQCCEHLNRALVVERELAEKKGWEIVCVLPQPKAGGSFATAVWQAMQDPVAVEAVAADAGMDIGHTLIGMHLKRVAVPIRLSLDRIGEAPLVCARTRPKKIGGPRACYPTDDVR